MRNIYHSMDLISGDFNSRTCETPPYLRQFQTIWTDAITVSTISFFWNSVLNGFCKNGQLIRGLSEEERQYVNSEALETNLLVADGHFNK